MLDVAALRNRSDENNNKIKQKNKQMNIMYLWDCAMV